MKYFSFVADQFPYGTKGAASLALRSVITVAGFAVFGLCVGWYFNSDAGTAALRMAFSGVMCVVWLEAIGFYVRRDQRPPQ